MPIGPEFWLTARLRRQATAQWLRLADRADELSPVAIARLQQEALASRQAAEVFLDRADRRRAAPRPAGPDATALPPGTDWHWRPETVARRRCPAGIAAPATGTRIAPDTTLWHDCTAQAAVVRQMPRRSEGAAPFAVQIDTLGFAGSYLSLAIDLPPEACEGLSRAHVLRLDTALTVERPLEVYARLHVCHGPNTDDMLLHVGRMWPAPDPIRRAVEFDLHYVEMNERQLDRLWLSLIFEAPLMNAATIHDLVLSRHPRAEM